MSEKKGLSEDERIARRLAQTRERNRRFARTPEAKAKARERAKRNALTPEGKEKARARSERHRRRKGALPRPKQTYPWLTMGISMAAYYRRRKESRRYVSPVEPTGVVPCEPGGDARQQ